MRIYVQCLLCLIAFAGFAQAEYIDSIPTDRYKLAYQAPSTCNDSFVLSGGQVLIFEVKNVNTLGTIFSASANVFSASANGQSMKNNSMKTIIIPQETKRYRIDGRFGNEPMRWQIKTSTDSDACVVLLSIWSTWANGMPPNPQPSVSDKLDIHIPYAIYNPLDGNAMSLWADFTFYGTDSLGNMLWMLSQHGVNGIESEFSVSFSEDIFTLKSAASTLCSSSVGTTDTPYWPDNQYVIVDAQIGDVDGDGTEDVVTIAHHRQWYPGQVAVFDKNCELQGRYWNPGFVYSMQLADIRGDSSLEIIVGATNNDYVGGNFNVPTIFALSGDNISGEAPPDKGSFPAGSEIWYTPVNMSTSEGIRNLSISDGKIVGNTKSDGSGDSYCVDYTGNIIDCEEKKLFQITSTRISMSENMDAACVEEFGVSYRMADWNDIQNSYTNNISADSIIKYEGSGDYFSAWVSRNGNGFYSNTRHYFASRHQVDHNKPSYYLAHDNINNHLISLGSWYNNEPVLCYKGNG